MLRKSLVLAALAALLWGSVALALGDAKKAINLDVGGANVYRAGEIYQTPAAGLANGAADSTRIIKVLNAKQIWVELYAAATGVTQIPHTIRIAMQVRDVACWDSAAVAEGLKGYPGGDTSQSISRLLGTSDGLGALSDTLCYNAWVPRGIRMTGTYPTDSATVGNSDSTFVIGTHVWPNEIFVVMPQRKIANSLNTGALTWQPAVYYFPLADANGVFFRANWMSLRFRNIGTGTITLRCRLVLFKD